jgi:hypothetical protein
MAKRESLLDRVYLSDGRLAWPVAAALGMSEVVFRARLKIGQSPDAATFRPVAKRDAEAVEARRERAMEFERAAKAERERAKSAARSLALEPHLDVASHRYFGVVAQRGAVRVAVHATGKSYLVQVRNDDGVWETVRRLAVGSLLPSALMYDGALLDACERLPDDPREALNALRSGGVRSLGG